MLVALAVHGRRRDSRVDTQTLMEKARRAAVNAGACEEPRIWDPDSSPDPMRLRIGPGSGIWATPWILIL